MGQGSWDMPWDDPRGGRRRPQSWSSGPPPWLQGLIGLAQSGALAVGTGQAVVDVDAARVDAEGERPVALGGQILGHRWTPGRSRSATPSWRTSTGRPTPALRCAGSPATAAAATRGR